MGGSRSPSGPWITGELAAATQAGSESLPHRLTYAEPTSLRLLPPTVSPKIQPAGHVHIGKTGALQKRFNLGLRGTLGNLRRTFAGLAISDFDGARKCWPSSVGQTE